MMPMDDFSREDVELGGLCKRVTVGHVGPMADQYQPDGIPFLRSQDIQPFGINTHGIKFIDENFNAKLRKSILAANDVVIVRTGYPGTAAVVPRKLEGANCADLVIITPGPFLDPWFVVSLLNSTWGRGTVAGNLVGVAQQHFNVGAARSLRFRMPPISVQRRIGRIIKAYCDLIEVNDRRIAILEEIARRLFDEWIINTPAAGTAEGWREARLQDLVEDVRDPILPSQVPPDTLYVGLEHMPRRSTTLLSAGRAGEVASTKLRFCSGDILFGKIRPYFHKVVFATSSGVTSSDSIVMRPRTAELTPFALCLVSSDAFVAHAVQTSNGTKMPRANWNVLRNYPVAVPPTSLFARFADIVGSAIELCSKLASMNANLRTARDLLLPKLIAGEIDLVDAEPQVELSTNRAAAE
jgi:type I restriction enzyme S subunit